MPRGWLIAGGIVLTLVVALALCEAAGWPFLVDPLQHALTKVLDRRFVASSDAGGQERVRIGLLGSVRVKAPSIEIGAPAWSQAPHMILAKNAALKLGYLDLWRAYRGGPLRIAELRADTLDAQIERLEDGRASWQFGTPKPADPNKPTRLPSFGDFRIGDGRLLFRDAILQADLDARFSLTERDPSAGSPREPASGVASIRIGTDPGEGASGPSRAGADASPSASASSAASAAGSNAGPTGAARDTGGSGLTLQASGQYRKLPLRIDLRTSGVLDLAGPDADKITQPVVLNATIGRARVRFDGAASDALHLTGLRGRFSVEGPSLAAVGDPLGVTLPTTGPFRTAGFLAKDGDLWKAVFDEATVGTSKLSGAFTFDRGQAVPLLSGRLNGSRLVLADLGPAIGAPVKAPAAAAAASAATTSTAKPQRVLPDRRFDLPSLRAMNANVLIDIAYLDLGTSLLEPLKPLRTHLRLLDGVLALDDVDARTAEGRLTGALRLDGRQSQALWNADLRLLGVRLEHWLHQSRGGGAPPYIAGLMDAAVQVSGAGRSTADILGSLGGSLRFHLRNASVSHLAIEAAGIDPAQAIGVLFRGDDALKIDCNVIDLGVEKGVARPKIFVLDTRDSVVWIDGTVSLQNEALDLRAIVSPKDFSPFTLRTPIHVKGTFSSPSVSLEKGKVGAKVGAAALLSLLNPLAAVIPFIDPGAKEDAKREAAQCAALAQRSKVSVAPPTAKKP